MDEWVPYFPNVRETAPEYFLYLLFNHPDAGGIAMQYGSLQLFSGEHLQEALYGLSDRVNPYLPPERGKQRQEEAHQHFGRICKRGEKKTCHFNYNIFTAVTN